MLVLENCAPFGKKCRNYASTFYFNFVQTSQMQQTSKWQTYLSYLHLETLRVHNINSLAITVVLTISSDNLFNLAPCKGIRIPESGKFLHLESGILEIFACGIRNPGPWNPEYR